eukprot:CAMPEP_0195070468 /NCGR_PEP_ID=MMETSP0448-20130528/14522_1 /TAXON_ID=66468 /ORGANISM="Heterocapsa triquestra, Strain CCMP 448" /LENGTH=40 /DNA_ID= /DNA_START= /DNA_END= /DNA_ORIENTATION=
MAGGIWADTKGSPEEPPPRYVHHVLQTADPSKPGQTFTTA